MWLLIGSGIILFFGFMAFTGAPYVPSKRRDVRQALSDLYRLDKKDTLVDIGAGDGIVLREASQRGARAVGYEINPIIAWIAMWLSRKDPRVTVKIGNFWRESLPDSTTVVYTFGDDRDIKKMYAKVEREATRLQRTLVFISYGFDVKGVVAKRQLGAYYRYDITPLQGKDSTV